jgi:hypothetical protein
LSGQNFSFASPTQSTVTYGLTVGSMTVSPPTTTNGMIQLTISGSTYTVTSSSGPTITAGHCVEWGSTNYALVDAGAGCGTGGGGTPGGSNTQLQYNNAGAFAGALSAVTSSSLTVISSMVVTSNGNTLSGPVFFGVFGNQAAATDIFAVGSTATSPLFEVQANNPVRMLESGAFIGNLQIGGRSDGDNVGDAFSIYEMPNTSGGQGIKLFDSLGNLDIFTAAPGQGGNNGAINFIIGASSQYGVGGTKEVAISSFGVTMSTNVLVTSSVTIRDTAASDKYSLSVTTNSTNGFFHVAISTNGDIVTNSSNTAMGTCGTSPSVVGDNNEGIITVGGGVVTACTMNFANAGWGNGCNVVCSESDNSTTVTGDISSLSSTSVTFSFSATLGGGLIYYQCRGYGSACK